MNNQFEYSVIIPNLNSPVLYDVITKLMQHDTRYIKQIIVIGSNSLEIPSTKHVEIVLIKDSASRSVARNVGASLASGNYLLFLDSDCVPQNNILDFLVDAHQHGYDIVSGSISYPKLNFWANCYNLLISSKYYFHAPSRAKNMIPAFCMSISKKMFLSLDGFNQKIDIGEDTDFCIKARSKNYKIYFQSKAIVAHFPMINNLEQILKKLYNSGLAWGKLIQVYNLKIPNYLNKQFLRSIALLPTAFKRTSHLFSYYEPTTLFSYAALFFICFLGNIAWVAGQSKALDITGELDYA